MLLHTYTGKKFCPQSPKLEDICLEDIARSLSMTCRFNGHVQTYYSVAEHCVRLSLMDNESSPQWRLMHDAAEAYLGDMVSPVKSLLRSFHTLERTLLMEIAKRFKLDIKDYNYAVMAADMKMLATEARDIVGIDPIKDWKMKTEPLSKIIKPWSPEDAECKFLRRAKILGIK